MDIRRIIVAVLALLVLAYVGIPGWASAGGDVLNAYTATVLASVIAVVGAVLWQRPTPTWPWAAIALFAVAALIGDMIHDSFGTGPAVSVAGGLSLTGYLVAVVALARLLRIHGHQLSSDTAIETAIVGIAALYAVWVLVVDPAWSTAGPSTLERSLVAAYPVLGAVIITLLVQLQLLGKRSFALGLLTAGMLATFGANGVYASLQQTSAYATLDSPWLDATWLVSYVLLAAAALHPSMRELGRPPRTLPSFGPGRLLVAGAALFTLPLSYSIALWLEHEPSRVDALLFTLVSLPLLGWRVYRLQRDAERSRTYYRSVAMHASDAFLITDPSGTVIDVSGALEPLTGTPSAALIGTSAHLLLVEQDRELGDAVLRESVRRPGETVSEELRIHTDDGGWRWAAVRCTNLLHDPAVRGIVINIHDATDRKLAEEQLAHQALHDPLTGLANRTLLRDRTDHALARRQRNDEDVAIIFCDLDGFKAVNDSLGHAAGDRLLAEVAVRLVDAVRPSDTVARLGGDEFAVLLEGSHHLETEAATIAERVRQVVSDPVVIEGMPLVLTASIGLAIAGHDGQQCADELLRDADTAMYEAKEQGRDCVVRYQRSMREAAVRRVELDADLRRAVARDELTVQYQPILDLRSGRLVGFEALLRWQHPTLGPIPPAEFIPIAEHSGIIVEIGTWVLDQACRAAAGWAGPAGDDALSVNVNVSARQLVHAGLVETVRATLDRYGLPPRRLVLELTETALVDQPAMAAERLGELRELGVRIAIDDFGIGYSSLAYLRQFPTDILKIDRSFIGMIDDDEHIPGLVQGLLELGHTLGLETVAEGIETGVQLDALSREGCRLGQGFLFARPLEEHTASELAADELAADELAASTSSGPPLRTRNGR